ncbi:MAG: hypothetical protein ACE10G_04700 [Gemmatimonadales bacterium]
MAKVPRGQRTLKRCVDSYLDRQRVRSKLKSVRGAECSCGHLLRVLGNRSIYSLTESDGQIDKGSDYADRANQLRSCAYPFPVHEDL